MLDFFVGTVAREHFNNENGTNNKLQYDRNLFIVSVLVSFASAYLAWTCNCHESTGARVFLTILAYLFGGLYLMYYFILYILLGKACGKK
jgi:hypothetical protein